MRRPFIAIPVFAAGVLVAAGCYENRCRTCFDPDDVVAPAPPREVYSVTGDGAVTVYWSPPGDADLAGFRVSVSSDDRDYWSVGDVPAGARHLEIRGDMLPANAPFDFQNGSTYWLAVQAADWSGNLSPLADVAVTADTPRPAGRDLRLYAIQGARRSESGYDFSRSPYGYTQDGNSLFADIYFSDESLPMMRTAHPQVVEMQDKGWLDFDAEPASWLDESDWLPQSAVVLHVGHVVVVKIYEETRPGNASEPFNVAKFRVTAIEAGAVVLDWAYQIQPNSRELKPGASQPVALEVRR